MGRSSSFRIHTESPPNFGVPVGSLDGRLSQDDMYVRCNFELPETAPTGFDVVVPGRATRHLTPADLTRFSMVETYVVLECAGNGRTLMEPVPEGTSWGLDGVSPIVVSGVRLSEVLGDLPDDIEEIVLTGADHGEVDHEGEIHYQFSLDRALATSETPLLVTHIGGDPLSLEHGAPVRLVVPGEYAMKSVKWLTRIEAITARFAGHFVSKYRYFGDRVEPEAAPVSTIAVRSLITQPRDGEQVDSNGFLVRGLAWTGMGRVIDVDVSVDGGSTWVGADLDPDADSDWAPVTWSVRLALEPGVGEIVARATDSEGRSQPLTPRWNANGYANNVTHRVSVEVG